VTFSFYIAYLVLLVVWCNVVSAIKLRWCVLGKSVGGRTGGLAKETAIICFVVLGPIVWTGVTVTITYLRMASLGDRASAVIVCLFAFVFGTVFLGREVFQAWLAYRIVVRKSRVDALG